MTWEQSCCVHCEASPGRWPVLRGPETQSGPHGAHHYRCPVPLCPDRPVGPGDRVTWNEAGKTLFGDTGSQGLLVEVRTDYPGQDGAAGHVLWESGQDTWASIACLTHAAQVQP